MPRIHRSRERARHSTPCIRVESASTYARVHRLFARIRSNYTYRALPREDPPLFPSLLRIYLLAVLRYSSCPVYTHPLSFAVLSFERASVPKRMVKLDSNRALSASILLRRIISSKNLKLTEILCSRCIQLHSCLLVFLR